MWEYIFLYFFPANSTKSSLRVKVELFLFAHLSGDFTPSSIPLSGMRNPPDAFAHKNLTLFVSVAKLDLRHNISFCFCFHTRGLYHSLRLLSGFCCFCWWGDFNGRVLRRQLSGWRANI